MVVLLWIKNVWRCTMNIFFSLIYVHYTYVVSHILQCTLYIGGITCITMKLYISGITCITMYIVHRWYHMYYNVHCKNISFTPAEKNL